jgi:uncharacterized protein (TIGR03083 family)
MIALPRLSAAEAYCRTRMELLDLATGLHDDQTARMVPACPEWTVKDVYAHLTGVASDLIGGRTDGVATPAWTARQVESRRGATLAEVCAEWAQSGPEVDAWLAEREDGPTFVARAAFDAWTHEQDVRGALGLRGVRDDERVAWLAGQMASLLSKRFENAGTPALRVGDVLLGAGAPRATLAVSQYELVRICFGRRSEKQILAAEWDGDPSPYLDQIHVFALAAADLVD